MAIPGRLELPTYGLGRRYSKPGIVLIDRFNDGQIDKHLVEKFQVGLTGLPSGKDERLSNVVGFHYSAVGQSHFPSIIDVVIGSLRFSINAFSRNEEPNLKTAGVLLALLKPLFPREGRKAQVGETTFTFSPKTIKVEKFRNHYLALQKFLADCGIDTAQTL